MNTETNDFISIIQVIQYDFWKSNKHYCNVGGSSNYSYCSQFQTLPIVKGGGFKI